MNGGDWKPERYRALLDYDDAVTSRIVDRRRRNSATRPTSTYDVHAGVTDGRGGGLLGLTPK
jgi:hypothetical protein